MPPQPSEITGGGASGCPRRLSVSKTFFEAFVSVLVIPRATRKRVSVSIIVDRQNWPVSSVSA